jgi:hypothetical protein
MLRLSNHRRRAEGQGDGDCAQLGGPSSHGQEGELVACHDLTAIMTPVYPAVCGLSMSTDTVNLPVLFRPADDDDETCDACIGMGRAPLASWYLCTCQ